MEATQRHTWYDAVSYRFKTSNIVFGAILLASTSAGYGDNAPKLHPAPWPIRHWRNHQPRRSDITPEQSRKIDRLYMRIEKDNPQLIAPDFRSR